MKIFYPQLHDGSNSSKKHLQIAEGPIQLLRCFCWSTHLHLPKLPSESESRIHTRRATRFWSRQFWEKQLGFNFFFAHPEPWGIFDPIFWLEGIFWSKGFREKPPTKTRKQPWEANSGGILSIDSSVFRLRQRSPNRPVPSSERKNTGELAGNPDTVVSKERCFFPSKLKWGERVKENLQPRCLCALPKCFVFDSETLLLCTQRMTAT